MYVINRSKIYHLDDVFPGIRVFKRNHINYIDINAEYSNYAMTMVKI